MEINYSRETNFKRAIEAILMVITEPVSVSKIANVLETEEKVVIETLLELQQEYSGELGSRAAGFELRNLAGGWRIYSHPDFSELVTEFIIDGQTSRLSSAALETLAVIAYKEPVSRAKISAIRGVSCDSVIRTLLTRGIIESAGMESTAGATLYKTTKYFLEKMGLNSLDELPDLAPFLPSSEMLDELEKELQ